MKAAQVLRDRRQGWAAAEQLCSSEVALFATQKTRRGLSGLERKFEAWTAKNPKLADE